MNSYSVRRNVIHCRSDKNEGQIVIAGPSPRLFPREDNPDGYGRRSR